MGAVGSCALAAPSDDDTNASFRTKSQSFLHGARNCSEWPDKLLPVASITASARRSTLRFEPDQTQPSIAYPCAFRLASFAESRTLHRVRCRQATVIALPCGAHHHKLHIGKFDAHDPTLPFIQKARRSRPPHQDEPRIDQSRWGGWVTRARRAASNTNASFRTANQSFLTRAVPRERAGARLENRPSQDAAVRQTLGERIAAVIPKLSKRDSDGELPESACV